MAWSGLAACYTSHAHGGGVFVVRLSVIAVSAIVGLGAPLRK